ncbi:MAG: M48 family metallopeptidase [Leptospirales bacterium]|nr:M48 family metallopeptidase [Leptospirales bacterium]
MFNAYYWLIITFFVLNFAWEQILDALNKKRMTPDMPQELNGIYDPQKYTQQQAYQKENYRFSLISDTFFFIISFCILLFGLIGMFDELLRNYIDGFMTLPLAFFLAFTLAGSLLNIPFRWYHIFVIEERFGFNKSNKLLFAADTVKSILLKLAISAILLAVILIMYRYTGQYFWITAWAAVALILIVINLFYSEWIVPLFNKQTPLEEGELKNAILSFAEQAGFAVDNIYMMDASKRSTKANAYFTGFGKKKRIILFDTLIEQLTVKETVAVLAHEIGHYKKKHVLLNLLMSLLSLAATFYLMSLFLDNLELAQALGGKTASFHLGLVGFMFIFRPVSALLGLITNYISRRYEYQADAFTVRHGLGEEQISALKKISTQALSNMNPHPWAVFWRYSHPPLLQRIKKIRA